jgi:polyhydroxybutyrate depolymerase
MRRLAPTALALALVAGACGGDDSSTDGAAADDPTTTSTTAVALDPAAVEPRPSAGCGAGPTVAAGETIETVEAGDRAREYFQHVPPGHDGTTPVPVVIDFHGYAEGGQIHVLHSQLGRFGDEQGFVTISPDSGEQPPRWNTALDSRDVAFFGDLLDQVEADLCLDTARVFVTGLSNGAFMTSSLACTYSERIAAVAPVAGLRDPEGCHPERPVPVIAFHGTEDTFVAFDGGLGDSVAALPAPGGGTLGDVADEPPELADGPSLPEIAAVWAERGGCAAELQAEPVADDVALQAGVDCPEGIDVQLYVVDGGGHTWPGSEFDTRIEPIVGPVTMSISANELMWEFFQEHPLPA